MNVVLSALSLLRAAFGRRFFLLNSVRNDVGTRLRTSHLEGSFRDLRGILKGKTNGARLSIEEINEATRKAGDTGLSGVQSRF